MKTYLNEHWRSILAHNGLADFAALWQLKADWFEEPNRRRGGWSGVARCELMLPGGGTCAVFLKRQENHNALSVSHPLRGLPTFYREFRQIMRYRKAGIPAVQPVYFGMRREGKDYRAILITEELAGFVSMEDRVQSWLKEGAPPRRTRLRYLEAIATLMRSMHAKGIQHNCFFPKHLFTRVDATGSVEVRIIDLEKSRWRPSRTISALRDLYTLNHDSLCWSRSDRLWFFLRYLQLPRLTPYAKWLWHRIETRSIRKKRYRTPPVRLSTTREQQATSV
jgi:hypothetical protein